MKKLLVIFFISVYTILVSFAQPNGGFENWSAVFNYQNPDNWQTMNFLSMFSPNPLSAFKATGIDKHSGNYALKLKTIFISNNPAPGVLKDTLGYFFTGKVTISPPSLKFGIPYVGRPEKLEFWAKYLPVGTDLAGVAVILQRWNGIATDTIAYADAIIDSTLTYTYSQLNLNYYSNAIPDTVIIGFSSSYNNSLARVGSTLYIDDVAFIGWVGIDEKNINTDKVKVYPNPARGNVNINAKLEEADKVLIIDVSGKWVGEYKIQDYNANINTLFFEEGIYFYEIRDQKNRALSKGKFNVIK